MPLSFSAGTKRLINAGAGKATHKKPKPSIARNTSKAVTEVANPPKALANANKQSPRSMVRLSPATSAQSPMNTATLKPASCTMDNKNPACTRLKPSSACKAGKAGGNLPTCMAATPPAKTTSQGADTLNPLLTAAFGLLTARARAKRIDRSCPRCSRRPSASSQHQSQSQPTFQRAGEHKPQTIRARFAGPVRWSP